MTTTVGRDAGHVEVSLWHVITGDGSREYTLDPAEFDSGYWWNIDGYALSESDPHFGRFLRKLDARPVTDRDLSTPWLTTPQR
ncbi:hypothetical protein IU450_28490 [Nocardia abscessus]|uniref:hypothetical protein n=1 Tax=Nocardia abscessus TaxID=120957 RepID=UPI0018939E5B|nr:hypothetical protein [Nocardia abscessus]MBF6339799.1 hypothetical protein [Nocardia abscessus]